MDNITPKINPLDNWDSMPLSHARILYDNKLSGASSASAELALIPNTYERWTSASGAMQATFQPAAAIEVDSVGIAAHNLFSSGATEITIETAPTIAGTFTQRAAITPSNDVPLLFLFEKVETVADIRITVTGGTDREIGVIYAGVSLQMYQPVYGGLTNPDLNLNVTYRNNISETGNFLGRQIIRQGGTFNPSFKHLDPYWVYERFEPFIKAAKTKPFFMKWRPDYYETTIFGFTTKELKPQNMGGHRLMECSLEMRTYA